MRKFGVKVTGLINLTKKRITEYRKSHHGQKMPFSEAAASFFLLPSA